MGRSRLIAATMVLTATLPLTPRARLEGLRASGGLPAHIAGEFAEPLAFQQIPSGQSILVNGDKRRTLQLQAAGLLSPTSLFFADRRRLLVTPGCYEFTVR